MKTMRQEDVMTSDTQEKYCPICGKPVAKPTYNRFGEWCCLEEHAEEFVKEVRAQKAQAATTRQARPVSPSRDEGPWYEEKPTPWWSRRPRWFGRRRRGC
jgi:hypothetical protein